MKTVKYRYDSQKGKMPSLCPKDREEEVKKLIISKLEEGELMYLSTLSPDGWPVTDCMHYAVVEGEKSRPVIYMFTHDGVRKLENIGLDERVSVSVCHAVSYEERKKTWSFQFMGTARVVESEEERSAAIKVTREKKGYEFAADLPLEKQPCIRIDPVFGSWMCGEGTPAACSIDYGREQ